MLTFSLIAAAALLISAVGWIGGRAYHAHRSRADKADRGGSTRVNDLAAEFALPPSLGSEVAPSEGAKARGAEWRNALHLPAIAAKNKYYEFIGRCGVALAFIFIQMALSLTLLEPEARLNEFFALVDLFAALYVLAHWWRAKRANQHWILKRVHAELMRQWLHLVFAYSWTEEEIAAAHADASRKIEAEILKPKSRFGFGPRPEELEARIETYWADLSQALKAKVPTTPSDGAGRLLSYLRARPLRQLQWYRMRCRQFMHAGHWRGAFMTGLFLFTLALAAVNLAVMWRLPATGGGLADWLNFALLVATAVSAALTYWYVSRNERSISHRYVTQRREIERWLRRTAALIEQGERALTYDQVLEFETVMTDELIDWVHITSHDAVELGA
jgi:hypothetical protein